MLDREFNVEGDWWFDGVLLSSFRMTFGAASMSMIAPDSRPGLEV